MTEELVTLETAKMLKEKGFNEYCKGSVRHSILYRGNHVHKLFCKLYFVVRSN